MKALALLLAAGIAVGSLTPVQAAEEKMRPHPGGWVEANWLIGTKIHDAEDRDIGKVKELWLDPKDGRIKEVIVSTGEVLGMGGKEQVLDWKDVKIAWRNEKLYVTVDPKLMRDVAANDKDRDNSPAASPKTPSRK